jgi:hypothetical protein
LESLASETGGGDGDVSGTGELGLLLGIEDVWSVVASRRLETSNEEGQTRVKLK